MKRKAPLRLAQAPERDYNTWVSFKALLRQKATRGAARHDLRR